MTRENKKPDPHAYVVRVLWLRGHSVGEIAKTVGWAPGAVRGFVNRNYAKPARSDMKDEQRQDLLSDLKQHREDGGRLRDDHFVIGRRAGVMRKRTTPTEDLDLNTRAGRKEARRREKESARLAEEERLAKERRELGMATRRGLHASALDYLLKERLLKDPKTDGREARTSEEQRRHEAGVKLRTLIEGTRLGGLGAFDYERATMGSGNGSKMSLPAYKLHCIHSIGCLRQMLCDADYTMIEAVIDQDEFLWERFPANSRSRESTYYAIRYQLDVVAVHENLMTHEAFKDRWGEDLPVVDRASKADAREQAQRAEEFLETARRA